MPSIQVPTAPMARQPAQKGRESFVEKKMSLDGFTSWELAPCGDMEIKFPPVSSEVLAKFIKSIL